MKTNVRTILVGKSITIEEYEGFWEWWNIYREPDDVLVIMYARQEFTPELPSWFEMAE